MGEADPDGSLKAQAYRILDEPDSEQYTLTEADIEGCRGILRRLLNLDTRTGGYSVGNVTGHKSSAVVTIHYEKAPGALVTSEAAYDLCDGANKFGLLLKKVIAHWNTNGDRLPPSSDFDAGWRAGVKMEREWNAGTGPRPDLESGRPAIGGSDDRLAKLEEFFAAHSALELLSDSVSYEHKIDNHQEHEAAMERFVRAEEALG